MYYIGTKIVNADPMTYDEFCKNVRPIEYSGSCKDGYEVVYEDGYTSWSPKNVFEDTYLGIKNDSNTITECIVDEFIDDIESSKLGERTTLVKVTLKNGFIITETSSAVSADNFDMEIGKRICLSKIKDKIWEFLGFLLITAKNGVDGSYKNK